MEAIKGMFFLALLFILPIAGEIYWSGGFKAVQYDFNIGFQLSVVIGLLVPSSVALLGNAIANFFGR